MMKAYGTDGGNDNQRAQANQVCGHTCAKRSVYGSTVQKCCFCVGASAPCSSCGPKIYAQYVGGTAGAAAARVVMQAFRGYDGSSVQLSSSQVATRDRRLDSNIKTLYHQTDPTAARAIVRSQTFRPGTGGIAGAGMYFAISKADTHHKAHSKGVILSCDVRLGNVKPIPAQGDRSVTFANLQGSGYDSVTIPRPGGTEYVVYHPDQVRNIAIC